MRHVAAVPGSAVPVNGCGASIDNEFPERMARAEVSLEPSHAVPDERLMLNAVLQAGKVGTYGFRILDAQSAHGDGEAVERLLAEQDSVSALHQWAESGADVMGRDARDGVFQFSLHLLADEREGESSAGSRPTIRGPMSHSRKPA